MCVDLLSRDFDRRGGKVYGITSVHLANPVVLRETLCFASCHRSTDMIEATCSRINLRGGYTGTQPADAAIAEDEMTVAESVAAGFRKLHLDCLMNWAGEPQVLDEATIGASSVRMASGPACLTKHRYHHRAGLAPTLSN
jgi:tagatose-1,6-bisphosphate aldolase non-catalytic subunit AgaZ/GatZ